MDGIHKRLKWYFRRLQAMSLGEIIHRLREKWLVTQERLQRSYIFDFSLDQDIQTGLLEFQHSDIVLDTLFHYTFNESTDWTFNQEETIKIANFLLKHNIALFHKHFQLDTPINWHKDPLTGNEWPQVFYVDVDIRDGRSVGGVKWVWELNRHHHLVTLAKAYYLTGEEHYAAEVVTQLRSWLATNPPFIGVNWTSALELALRLINWTWALNLVKKSAVFTSDFFSQITQSIHQQAQYISHHLSSYSSANNHLIGEAAGLAVVGMAFPWLTNAKQWCETGLTIMERELALQIYPDGVIKEQAVAYLTFVLDFNLIVWQLAQRTGHPVPDIWPERLGSACEFILYLIDKQGNVPAIGDDDDGWVLRLDDQTNANNYRSLLHSAAVILHRPEFKTGLWDEKSQWLLGENGRSTYNAFPVTRHPLTSRHFPNGGYIIMRHADTVITFDCGPLGYLATAAHGHADALSLTMNVDGQPILIDPGTYAYQEGYGWRDYFRSTSAHNTVVVDGRNQSEIQGSFLWGQQAHTTIRHWQTTPEYDFAIAEHDGYSKIGITHRRSVLFLKSSWLMVVDDLLGKGQHHINQLWHLHPNCHITVTTENIKVDINNTPKVFVHVSEMETAVIIGQQNPPQGWASSHYGHLEPAPVITASSQCYLPQRVMTVFCLANSDVNNIAHVQAQFVRLENEVNL